MNEGDRIRDFLARDEIVAVVTRLFVGTDARDWDAVRSCFADAVHFDMTSLAGGVPATLAPDQIIGGWQAALRPIQRAHHQAGNFQVRCQGQDATASCYGIAFHYRNTRSGRNTRLFVGTYDFHLRHDGTSWRIDAFRFEAKFVDGNLELENEPGRALRPAPRAARHDGTPHRAARRRSPSTRRR